ncbi:MAG: DJ-1/PfpI family protein [Microcoleus sp. SIO2G3]|nr:DJ-1/PfpI family protein [Microcoleus sp. SIO2G3]
MKNIAIFVFNDVEVLDFAGPFEVFSVTGRRNGSDPFNVYLVAENSGAVLARNQFSINPHYSFENCPDPDILLIPGGGGYTADGRPFGTRREMDNLVVREWVQRQAAQVELLLSVCTGALILAKAGLLEGRRATTHHGAIDSLRQLAPNTEVTSDRIVDNGDLILSGGISAGIDMSLYVVAKRLGRDVAIETASYMEYDWRELSSSAVL